MTLFKVLVAAIIGTALIFLGMNMIKSVREEKIKAIRNFAFIMCIILCAFGIGFEIAALSLILE